jgi:AGCS family alanine or glycine:cation symporter
MILLRASTHVAGPSGGFLVENLPGVSTGPQFTQQAIASHFPALGAPFVAVALFFFAFTTLMAYYYIAETNLSYLNKTRHGCMEALGFTCPDAALGVFTGL